MLILVRHGATLANVQRPYRLQGLRPDPDLIEAGREQALAAALALREYPISKVYCSPLKRAVHTAKPIAGALGLEAEPHPAFLEADVGEWTALTWAEVEQRWPKEHRAFHQDAEIAGYFGGENLAQVRDRVWPSVRELRKQHEGETIAVVSHGVVNRVLLAQGLGLPLRFARRLPQDNGGFNVLDWEGDGCEVRTINATRHLERLRAARAA
jgi:broad specificity phosphatase PhoE